MNRRARHTVAVFVTGAFLSWLGWVAFNIASAGRPDTSGRHADVALVLGASAPNGTPSPVFAARIDHAIALQQSGRVRFILFTGGTGTGERQADADAARNYALGKGVPADRIWCERRSHTTRQNLAEAKHVLMQNTPNGDCLLVSDPLHLFRALRMAKDTGIVASPSPAPDSRIRGTGPRLRFFARELWFYHVYLLTGD